MFVSPQNSYVEAPTPNVVDVGCGAFGGQLGLDGVMRVGPHGDISAFIRRGRDQSSFSLCTVQANGCMEDSCLQARWRALTTTQACRHPDLRLPSFRL